MNETLEKVHTSPGELCDGGLMRCFSIGALSVVNLFSNMARTQGFTPTGVFGFLVIRNSI